MVDQYSQMPAAQDLTDQDYAMLQDVFNSLQYEDQLRVLNIVQERGLNPQDQKTTLKVFGEIGGEAVSQGKSYSEILQEKMPSSEYMSQEEERRKSEIDKLIEEERGAFETMISGEQERRQKRFGELTSLLAEERDRAFAENTPGIYEDLSSRGLLRSSAAGEALAEEKGRLQRGFESALKSQELADLDVYSNLRQQMLGQEVGLRTAGYERELSLEDLARQAALAREIAQMQAQQQDRLSRNQLIAQGLGTLGSLGLTTAMMMK